MIPSEQPIVRALLESEVSQHGVRDFVGLLRVGVDDRLVQVCLGETSAEFFVGGSRATRMSRSGSRRIARGVGARQLQDLQQAEPDEW